MLSNLVLHEDEHLLVINKPAGMNTHSPSPFAGEGIYEWLKNREPRWAKLAIIHRLDKETSGVMVFGKTTLANRSLTEQFTQHTIRKSYVLLTDRPFDRDPLVAKSWIVRAGEKYLSRSVPGQGDQAETKFQRASALPGKGTRTIEGHSRGEFSWIVARPVTGRTHQIRVHAAEHGFPIFGDTLYGGTKAERVFLHAHELVLKHPATGAEMRFEAKPEFELNARLALRTQLIESSETNAFRMVHGASDGSGGLYVDRLGDFLLSQSEQPLSEQQKAYLDNFLKRDGLRGAYHKTLNRHVRGAALQDTSPRLVLGESAPPDIVVAENGLRYVLRFHEGYSVGLFLDQRENRRRIMTGYIAPDFLVERSVSAAPEFSILNTFSYTCSFSVAAAKGGGRVTSLDLSKKYLEWGKENFTLNGLDPAAHDFIFGDVFDWLRRFQKKGRLFDVILLDPPTFSQSREHGVFRAEKDYGKLAAAAVSVLKPNGILFSSTNAEDLKPEKFLETVNAAVVEAKRKVVNSHYVPQPPDFPISREEGAYLKTVWMQIA